MTADPTLIIQMQRMGDLIISFALCSRLKLMEPDRPVWLVAEPLFSRDLMALAPEVVFFAPDMGPQLATARYRRVINLSHRPEALDLAGSLATGERVGAFRRDASIYMEGDWRLYRASLVGNNRHNRFHWGDLESLGLVPPSILAASVSLGRDSSPPGQGRVGLFVGASEAAKRPDPPFWAELGRLLLRRGFQVFLLGGPDDRPLAAEAARLGKFPQGADLSGAFRLSQLAAFMRTLDLVVTPDTGPMHLAAWVGAPVLNLSMGPVNAWETAAGLPGHLVLRPTDGCVGCWGCTRSGTPCRERFRPAPVFRLCQRLLRGEDPAAWHEPHLHLYRTGRDARGLYTLDLLSDPEASPQAEAWRQRAGLAAFWQESFLAALGGAPHRLSASLLPPRFLLPMQRHLARLAASLSSGFRRRSVPDTFWAAFPPLLRPLSGYLHLLLQNGNFSTPAWRRALDLAAFFSNALNGNSLRP